MDLIQYVEKNINQKIEVSESELRAILNSQNCLTISNYEDIKEELVDEWRINQFIVDYVNFGELAESNGYERIDNDTFIHKSAFKEFCNFIKDKDINKVVI